VSRLASGRRITAGPRIGGGGEAEIFAVREDAKLALKRYTKPTRERHDKVKVMAGSPPASSNGSRRHVQIAWPVELVFSDAGAFEGFVMPRIDSAAAIQVMALYNPQSRHQHAPAFTWKYLLRTAMNVATAVQDLHARGYVVGDLNESNVLVTSTALVTIVDCDSMQVRAPDGRVFRSLVGKPEFMAPELVGRDLASTDRTPASDNFALAVLVYHLLMEGTHPFTGVWKAPGDPPPIPERIQRGLFALAGDRLLAPPSMGLPFSTLPPELRRLFQEAFRAGGPPTARPTATRWRHALEQVEHGLKKCRRSEHHVFGGHLRSCPWCERSQQLFDPFPGPSRQNPLPSAPFTTPTAPPKVATTPPRPTRPQPVTPPPKPAPARPVAPSRRPAPAPRKRLPPQLVVRLRALAKALVGALLLALGTGAAVVAMLQVDNGWLDKHARDRLPADPSAPGHWGPIVLAGAAILLPACLFGLPLLHDGLVRLVPPLAPRRSAWQRRAVVTAAVAAMGVIGTQSASPGLPAGRVLVEQTLPDGAMAAADDFSSNRAGWSTRKLAAGRAAVTKGSYRMLLTRPDALVIGGSRSLKGRLAAVADVRVDVRAVIRRGGNDPVFGVLCRYQDDRHYYLVGLTGNGRYRVDKRLGDRWVQLQGWRAARTVRSTGANRVQLACTGGGYGSPVMLALAVNGQRVTQVVDRGRLFGSSPTIAGGSVALFVRSRTAAPVDVAFDDLAVRRIDRAALPLPGTTGLAPWRLITENA
jgi:protein kinase-like protein